jgi:putative DNA primase/helicase
LRAKEGWKRSYATATHIDNIYAWVQRRFAVAPSKINPPGLNCLNGVVKISWQGKQPSYELVKHDPSVVYTYVGEFEFDPKASSETCDRLLQCLALNRENPCALPTGERQDESRTRT